MKTWIRRLRLGCADGAYHMFRQPRRGQLCIIARDRTNTLSRLQFPDMTSHEKLGMGKAQQSRAKSWQWLATISALCMAQARLQSV